MALLPPHFMDAVVAIGTNDGDDDVVWIGSGFLYGHLMGMTGEDGNYRVYLVTNRHVVKELKEIVLRFNPVGDEPARLC